VILIRSVLLALSIAMATPHALQAQSGGARVKDSMVGIDKLKHFLLSGFVESVAFAGFQAAGVRRDASLAGAGVAVTVVAVGREVHGRRTGGLFSVGDLVWDALGAGAAMLILTRIGR
jgi:uncharacterized protein YfiM (DUF2279 family)